MAKLAFLGLGAMGSRMAANLAAAGHDLAVWNRTADRASSLASSGARVAATPREAARDAEFVVAMLRYDEASRAVWTAPETGALSGMPAAAVAIECSTLSLAWTQELAAACSARGQAFVDAPLAGSRPQAEAKSLIFLAGGEPGPVERVRPILLQTGATLHHVGPAGTGMAVKLAVNTLFATQVAAMAELLEIMRKAAHDADEMVRNTPSAAELKKLYEREDGGRSAQQ